MSAGGWSGHVRSADFNYNSIAGLVPNSDALSYFADATRLAFVDGHWGIVSSRRPLAQAFRQLTVFLAGYSYLATLVVQAGMLAVLLFWAARSVARWRGIWAGIAFFGFVFLLHRPYLNTTMTEPLGLACALLALVSPHRGIASRLAAARAGRALRADRRAPDADGQPAHHPAARSLDRVLSRRRATMARRGPRRRRGRDRGRAAGTARPDVWFDEGATGENFAYTICGLSLGTDWFDCLHGRYAAELARLSDQRAIVQFVAGADVGERPAASRRRRHGGCSRMSRSSWSASRATCFLRSGPWSTSAKVMAGLGMLALVPGLLYAWRRRISKRGALALGRDCSRAPSCRPPSSMPTTDGGRCTSPMCSPPASCRRAFAVARRADDSRPGRFATGLAARRRGDGRRGRPLSRRPDAGAPAGTARAGAASGGSAPAQPDRTHRARRKARQRLSGRAG